MLRKHRAVSAGVVDAGLASLATFMVGLVAVRLLAPAVLGAYALVFAAFNLLAVVPRDLLFTPFEVAAVGCPRERRLAVFRQSIRLGGGVAVLAALSLSLWLLAAPPEIPAGALTALTVTGAACTFLSPVQDHLRRMQHLAGRSWAAAAVSGVQVAAAGGTLWTLLRLGVSPWWIPLGSLAAANLASVTFGLLASPQWIRGEGPGKVLDLAGTLRSGRWLLLTGLAAPGAGFLVGILIAHLAGAEALGYAEAARIVGQPVFVLSVGLAATLGPRSMEAARERRPDRAARIARGFVLLVAAAAAGYVVLVGFPWRWNPLLHLVPGAYEIAGLVPAVVLATALNGAALPGRSELLGAGREREVARVDMVGGALRVCVGATAAATRSFAMPLGFLVVGVVRWIGYRRALREVYGAEPADASAAEADTSVPAAV